MASIVVTIYYKELAYVIMDIGKSKIQRKN